MDTVLNYIKLKSVTTIIKNWSPFETVLVILICVVLIWYGRFYWIRMKIYTTVRTVFTIIFLRADPYDIFSALMKIFDNNAEISKYWFGPKCVYATCHPKYIEKLLPYCLEKDQLYSVIKYISGEGLFTAPYEKWKKHRKIISPTFNQKILDSLVPVFNEQSKILVDKLRNHTGKSEIDLFQLISNCTLDIICEGAMGVTVNAQTTNSFSKCCDKAMEIVFLRIFVWWYHITPLFNMTRHAKELKVCLKTIRSFTEKVVNDKIAAFEEKRNKGNMDDLTSEGPQRKAFLDYLLEITKTENSDFTEKQLHDEVVTFIVTGSDTTATTNGFIFTMLGLHQDLQDKVYNEVLDVIGPDKDVEPGDLPRLKYMEMFIKETLRLFPAGTFFARQAQENMDLGDNILIPAGVTVLFGVFKLHRNKLFWPDPLKFDPNRFLPEEVAKRNPCCYIPFSYGPRNCIGLKYAMMAMKSLVATVIRKYKIFTDYTNVKEIRIKSNLVTRPKDGYKVRVELR